MVAKLSYHKQIKRLLLIDAARCVELTSSKRSRHELICSQLIRMLHSDCVNSELTHNGLIDMQVCCD